MQKDISTDTLPAATVTEVPFDGQEDEEAQKTRKTNERHPTRKVDLAGSIATPWS
jgi:hypothetical protein